MALAFNLTQDPIELKEFLEVSLRSISTFIDSNMCTLTQILTEEKRAQFHEGSIDKRLWSAGCLMVETWMLSN